MFALTVCDVLIASIRFVDRDMLMRFHWGLAVGHVYAHQQPCTDPSVIWDESRSTLREDTISPNEKEMEDNAIGSDPGADNSGSESDDDDYEPSDEDSEDDSEDESEDNEDLLDTEEMYGHEDSED